jgi:nucleoside-diphosphate-sugar epimerase
MKKICITGANGFVGKSLCKALISSNNSIKAFARRMDSSLNSLKVEYIQIGDISLDINLKEYLVGCDCIVHCAGKAHIMNDTSNLDVYQSVNIVGTKNLAEQAVLAGVKRFIFLSSVKVNGESTGNSDDPKIFTNDDTPNPQDNYAISKFEAEKALWEIASKTNLEVVIVRLPLVYGTSAKGNLNRLIKLINSKIPLPFADIKNKRSLIGIDNLVDVLVRCIEHPNAAGKTFLVSDGEDLSTSELINIIASGMNRSVKLFRLPRALLKFFGFILMRQSQIDRLTGSLQIDNSYVRKILNWTPPVSIEEGIKRMVKDK